MKKFMKMAFAVVAFAAVGLSSYKAYGSYTAANMSEEDLLIAENVLALSDYTGQGCKHYGTVGCTNDSRRYSCKEGSGPTCTIHCGVKHEYWNCH